MANLLVGVLDKFGIHQASVGESAGKLEV
jgi:hypothetical protein